MSRDVVARFGRNFQALRRAKKITQVVLAEKIGTDQATISRLENGRHEPGLRFLYELAGGLKVPLAELFKDL
jgi:transcriptional regulator with XRE-family HTH domain